MEKEESEVLVTYLGKKEYPSKYTKDDKRKLRKKAESFRLVHEKLFHIGNKKRLQRVVTGEEERNRIIRTLHSNIVGGCYYN